MKRELGRGNIAAIHSGEIFLAPHCAQDYSALTAIDQDLRRLANLIAESAIT